MFFTQEDYRKIEQWLQRNSVKDTEFQEALPLNGLETITLVQDEHNKKVFIKDLVDQIFKLGVSDFLNVTDKYEASYITLNEAIKLIPSGARKAGQVITFLNTDGNWQVYQFKGVLNQWNQLDLWEDLFDWGKFVIDSILPDEEDLTKSLPDERGNSYLSLKDREYNPEDFSGLGRVILRKNIVDVEDPTYGKVKKNVLYQDMINKENTIYEIRYDFDLNGQEITIPEGCVLDFQGGSVSNGAIVYSKSVIAAKPLKIFDKIIAKGSVIVDSIYPEWWGAKADDNTDCLPALENAVLFSDCVIRNSLLSNNISSSDWHQAQEKINHASITLMQGVYIISKSWNISKPVNIYGNGATIKAKKDQFEGDSVIHITDVVSYNQGFYKDFIVEGSSNDVIGIITYSNTSTFSGLYIKNCFRGGIRTMRANTFNNIKIICSNTTKWKSVTDFRVFGFYIGSSDGYISNMEIAGYPVGMFISGSASGWLITNLHVWGLGCVMRVGIYSEGAYNYLSNIYLDTISKQDPNLGYVDIVNGIENGGMGIYEKWNHYDHYQNIMFYINTGVLEGDGNSISSDNVVAYFNGDSPSIDTITISDLTRKLMNPCIVYYNMLKSYPKVRNIQNISDYSEVANNSLDQSYRIKYTSNPNGFEGFTFSTRNTEERALDKYMIYVMFATKQVLWGQYVDENVYRNTWNYYNEEYDRANNTKTLSGALKAKSFIGAIKFKEQNDLIVLNKDDAQVKYLTETIDNNNLIIKEVFGRSGGSLVGIDYSLGLANYGVSSIKANHFIGNLQTKNDKILCVNDEGAQMVYLTESEYENLTIQQVFGRANNSLVTISYSIKCADFGESDLKAKTFIGDCKNSNGLHYSIHENGDSSKRPTLGLFIGRFYFDETLNKPIWWTGSKWVDATGATV